jgi:hypothetical protein
MMNIEGRNRPERRLAAILAADVVGYSRLIGADEEGTLDRLKAIRTEGPGASPRRTGVYALQTSIVVQRKPVAFTPICTRRSG